MFDKQAAEDVMILSKSQITVGPKIKEKKMTRAASVWRKRSGRCQGSEVRMDSLGGGRRSDGWLQPGFTPTLRSTAFDAGKPVLASYP